MEGVDAGRDGEQAKIAEWVDQVKGWLEPFLEELKRRPPDGYFC